MTKLALIRLMDWSMQNSPEKQALLAEKLSQFVDELTLEDIDEAIDSIQEHEKDD